MLEMKSETVVVCIPTRGRYASFEVPRPDFEGLEPGHRLHAVCWLDDAHEPEPEQWEYDHDLNAAFITGIVALGERR